MHLYTFPFIMKFVELTLEVQNQDLKTPQIHLTFDLLPSFTHVDSVTFPEFPLYSD